MEKEELEEWELNCSATGFNWKAVTLPFWDAHLTARTVRHLAYRHLESTKRKRLIPEFNRFYISIVESVTVSGSCATTRDHVRATAFLLSRGRELSQNYEASSRYLFCVFARSAAHALSPSDPELERLLDEARKHGDPDPDLAVTVVLLASRFTLDFSVMFPLEFFPVTFNAMDVALTHPVNCHLMDHHVNLRQGHHSTRLARSSMAAGDWEGFIHCWFRCHCPDPDDVSSIKRIKKQQLITLAKGLRVIPGRFMPDVADPDALLARLTGGVINSVQEIKNLDKQIGGGFSKDADLQRWSCSNCGIKFGANGTKCSSCIHLTTHARDYAYIFYPDKFKPPRFKPSS